MFTFAILMIIQIFGMIYHRIETMGHIISATYIRSPKIGKNSVHADKVIEISGLSLIKDLIQNVQVCIFLFQINHKISGS